MALSERSHRWLIILLSLVMCSLALFTVFGERGVLHLWRLWDEKKTLDEKIFLLQKENETLRERAYRMRHDDQYLERVAREELGLVRPGEIVYRFADSEPRTSSGKNLSDFRSSPPRSSEQKSHP
ncbi:MAG: septum formation initiator family protein [Deltaproteobacteria bacterium]|nr:septum formation initiator family protein [Deltaproteobacteria bacterium]